MVLEKEKSETEKSDKDEESKTDLYSWLHTPVCYPAVSLIPIGNDLFSTDRYCNVPLKPPRS